MFDRLTDSIDFHGKALVLRANRQEVISSNIANADTPNFKARDFDFSAALKEASGTASSSITDRASTPAAGGGLSTVSLARTHSGHQQLGGISSGGRPDLKYVAPEQPSMDGNTVDLNRERAQFSQNAVGYEASLRFINGKMRTTLSAIRGE
ncbi:MAG: flagellar basal body rod protein FlgB [Lautropia sp.]|nr:flagellar basal body rod protein FlgB [Lautropia sp.]